ncbi:MAG: DUF4867 family protein [Bacteroidales bacterium]|nr:DUF4867 family protein [Bacteroidales bacterium]MCQ2237579.1 DUF4867 family protein [Bacteroidales bacterium]
MEIKKITDPAFRKYGRLVTNVDFTELIEALKTKTPLPEGVGYEPSVPALEATATAKQLKTITFGELPIEVGYCNGHNTKLNALEYHRNSEINVAATDAVLLVGMQQDIADDFTYDTAKVEAFLLPAGQAAEIYATTLHYAPCSLSPEGFRVGIVLPAGTNYPLDEAHKPGEDKLITAKNKWLIGHKDGGLDANAFIGLKGENIDIAK